MTTTTAELAKKAKAEIKLGDSASSTAEKHYIAAGKFLLEAKNRVKNTITFRTPCGQEAPPGSVILGGKVVRVKFSDFLEKHGIAERTAQLHMSLALGKTTLTKVRADKRASVTKSRAKSALRSADSVSASVKSVSITRHPDHTIPLAPPTHSAKPPTLKIVNEPPTVVRPRYVAGKLKQLSELIAALAINVHREKNNLPESFEVEVKALVRDLLALIPDSVSTNTGDVENLNNTVLH
jgi:hypothetical protein